MRLRPLAALSAAAVSAVLLAGCSGLGGDGTPSDSATATPAADLCDARAASGDASDAVEVSGEPGEAPDVTFDTPLEIPELQTTVIADGSGDSAASGDFISYALSAFDATTGERLADTGFAPGDLLPAQISADNPLGQILGCGMPGERVVATFPATESASAEVYVVDLLSIVPTAAWGEPEPAVEGMPTVELAADGTPTITIDTAATPPTETEVATLKKGDGYTVASGDYVLIQFRGARWSTGELFDGGDTWDGGSPYAGQTTGFVAGFQKALEGQTVGSQVLVVIPPVDGYGEGEINTSDLKGETLVFVIDIIGAQKAAS